jgi:hypothetical protein
MKIQDNVITPEDGKWLTNGQTYSQQVWLGVRDSLENWREVDESNVPEEWKPQNDIDYELQQP